jgi:hypothetical protein
MKYLNDYTDAGISVALTKAGAFFAFGKKQFDEAKKEGVTYVNLHGGLICPKENVETLRKEMDENFQKAIEQDIAENGKEGIIKRELYNHECFYTGDIEDAVSYVATYGFTAQDVVEVYQKERVNANNQD